MRVGVLGGGPGGLYFALLLRRALPGAAVTVLERNRPDDTYGFGVVFSDETLGAFREADPPSLEEIAARFRRWDAIETYYRGTCTVSRGHGFAALSRRGLLGVLHDRCRELGVELRFEREVSSLAELAGEYDLVVAADGVNSLARRELAAELEPDVEEGACRFCWLGTSRPLGAFTFLFAETPHGLFQVHAYPFEDGMATWIVECREEVWRAAGLDGATEAETVAFCEGLFRDFLRGHALVANRSIWRRFPTVRCERWHHGNLALLGDAAHTAHFSVGSGTKLAMEDAIALAGAVAACAGDVEAGLRGYEAARRVEVLKLQKAAATSREWFEHSHRYMGQHPLQLAFNLMTRSKRITYENLGARDPALVAAVDAWYAGTGGAPVGGAWRDDGVALGPAEVVWRVSGDGSPAPREPQAATEGHPSSQAVLPPRAGLSSRAQRGISGSEAAAEPPVPPPMFVPFRARSVELSNRVVVSPMCQYSAVDGCPTDWHLVHLGSRAIGGAGLVIAEMTDVTREGRISHGCAGMYLPEHREAWRRIVEFVHGHTPARIGIQLAHAGRKGSARRPWEGDDLALTPEEGAWETVGPSPLPFRTDWPAPRELASGDLERLREAFVRATRWAAEAGFDWLELHMAHGYLLSSFLSPLANRRHDGFGGSLENRMRWPLEVFSAVREVWPESLPISVRLSATDWADGGITPDETVAVSRALRERGCDLIDVSSGGNAPDARVEYGRMYQVPFADRIRHEAEIPVMAVGALLGADHANTVLAAGRADLAVMARPHLADPYLTARAGVRYGHPGYPWPDQYLRGRPRNG